MDLETVIQNEVRKNRHHILTHMCGIWKNWYRWSYLQSRNRDTDVENTPMDMEQGEGSWLDWEVGTDTRLILWACVRVLYWYGERACVCSVSQLCCTLCDTMGYSTASSSVHEIFQVRTLGWVAISSSRASSWPRDRTRVSCVAGGFFTAEPLRKPWYYEYLL